MDLKISKIRPVSTLTQVDKIEMSLKEYFRESNFSPGDAIPKEIELAAAMKVSRTAIREALTRFKTLGIIESKKNRGMIITSPNVLNNVERVLDTQFLDGETMKEMFEMRLVLEVGIADLLFLRKTNENIEKLELIVAKEEQTVNKPILLQLDIEFHSTLYAMSGNKTIQGFQKMLLPIFEFVDKSNVSKKIKMSKPSSQTTSVSHRQLLQTLKEGKPEEFRNKMRNHLMVYFEKINDI